MPAPPESIDQQITAQFLTELAKIGVVPSSSDWLTVPSMVQELPPKDALDPEDGHLQIFFDHYQTVNRDDEAGDFQSHGWTYKGRIWIAAYIDTGDTTWGRATLRRAAADVWRCLQAAEATFTTLSSDFGLRFGGYQTRRDLEGTAGFAVGLIDLDVERSQLHGAT